jgi:hypothetical protein
MAEPVDGGSDAITELGGPGVFDDGLGSGEVPAIGTGGALIEVEGASEAGELAQPVVRTMPNTDRRSILDIVRGLNGKV